MRQEARCNVSRRRLATSGQASVELVAVVPILLGVALLVAQLAVAGWALWSAGNAARAGARAAYVGGSAGRAARSALPGPLRDGAKVSARDGVEVTVSAPALLPGVPRIPLSARTRLDPTGGGGG
jgi:pilus assembly protein CpaE